MNATQFQECIRILLCMYPSDFVRAFGEEWGPALWDKFSDRFDGDAAKFICYLDGENMRKLFAYFGERLDSAADRANTLRVRVAKDREIRKEAK